MRSSFENKNVFSRISENALGNYKKYLSIKIFFFIIKFYEINFFHILTQ